MSRKTKYIFVSGGVISALGKGVTAATISMLLKRRGFRVCPIKCENNLNYDFGTINPIEHGDPFLCSDGLEGDQDLGNYERFLEQEVGFPNFMTMGQLYMTVIQNERNLQYNGEDVEPIPHIVNEIIRRFHSAAKKTKADFVIVELGGTVGEYENNNGLYYEAARLMAMKEEVAHVHVTYILTPPHIGEPKTKPAQLGIKSLMQMGVTPNFIVVRAEEPIDEQRKYKFGFKFGIDSKNIFSAENLPDIHEVPVHLYNQGLDKRILEHFNYNPIEHKINIKKWKDLVTRIKQEKKKHVRIAIVGKYFGTGNAQLNDSYHALFHAINHAALWHDAKVDYTLINSDKEEDVIEQRLKGVDGIIVPIGWGQRGVAGKIKAVTYARTQKIPYLGLCYGLHMASIEFAQHVIGLDNATTEEINQNAKHKIIHSIPFDPKYQTIKGDGSSMRLGTFPCDIKKGTLAYKIYENHGEGNHIGDILRVEERHRHRFEFNNAYRQEFEEKGFVFSGTSPDNMFVEMIELPEKDHPFFFATQGHPEYKSYPLRPHPVFIEFIRASLKKKKVI